MGFEKVLDFHFGKPSGTSQGDSSMNIRTLLKRATQDQLKAALARYAKEREAERETQSVAT